MSIFSRLGRIIRANLNFRAGNDDKPGDFYDNSAENKNTGNPQYRPTDNSRRGNPQSKMSQYQDPELAKLYANMEVPYGSDLETVTRAWKRLLQKYHPDKHTDDPERLEIANKLVQELNRTYQELKKRLS
jgi:DnaJ-domain-containing protein 1